MEIIDAEWIEKRLTGKRGELAALARALGVKSDVISKIRRGERRVQPEEIPAVLAFFNHQEGRLDDVKQQLHQRIDELSDEEAHYLLGSVDALRARRQKEAL
ncbi:hypothetical protein [Paracoccus yeei]|uniref:hypothetical protein n=1 Tax=Paracoccus yeei TaxID=147645 RepID=UPI003BF88965